MNQFILNHRDAIQVLSRLIIPIVVILIVITVLIVYTTVRQKANKPLDSSNCKSKFASTYGGKNSSISNDSARQLNGNAAVSSAATRRAAASPSFQTVPQMAFSQGVQRQINAPAPRELAKPIISSDPDGILEFCLEYMEQYQI